MKNHLKKISAIVFALILVLSMCSLAFAATEGGTDAAMAVELKKSLKLKDTSSGIDLYAPEISYNYAVNTTALSAEELSYDASEGAVDAAGIVVKDGATAEGRPSVILGQNSISFSAADTIAAENNTEGSGLIVKEVSISTEPGTIAGIYRFRISETVEEGARETAGITHSEDYVSLRYLDVYIGYTNESMELSVKNVVLFRADGTAVTKTEGWTSANDLDTYETVDVMVTKTVTGSLADRTHYFPFAFELSDPQNGSRYSYKAGKADIVSGAEFGTAVNSGYGSATVLKHKETLIIYGVPKNTAVKCTLSVSEKNDTVDIYSYKTTGFANSDTEEHDFNEGISAVYTLAGIENDTLDLGFENILTEISPTGVVMRIAPYAVILCAGAVLMMISRKRKNIEA